MGHFPARLPHLTVLSEEAREAVQRPDKLWVRREGLCQRVAQLCRQAANCCALSLTYTQTAEQREGFVTCPRVQRLAHIYSGVGCRAYGPERWATGNPCMGPLMEPVQGLIRSSRMSHTPAAVPSVPLLIPHSGQQTESVAAGCRILRRRCPLVFVRTGINTAAY
jgi:hypothetical protein